MKNNNSTVKKNDLDKHLETISSIEEMYQAGLNPQKCGASKQETARKIQQYYEETNQHDSKKTK